VKAAATLRPSATLSTSSADPVAADGGRCRKCGAAVAGEACPRCGLARDRAAAWAAARPVSSAGLAVAWTATRAAWADPAAHDRVAALALAAHELPWLARCYREVDPAQDPERIAPARLERIVNMTLVALQTTERTPPVSAARRRAPVLVILAVVVLVVGALVSARVSAASQARGRPRMATPRGEPARGLDGTRYRPTAPPAGPAPAPPPAR
jgi:hypothetical protein